MAKSIGNSVSWVEQMSKCAWELAKPPAGQADEERRREEPFLVNAITPGFAYPFQMFSSFNPNAKWPEETVLRSDLSPSTRGSFDPSFVSGLFEQDIDPC